MMPVSPLAINKLKKYSQVDIYTGAKKDLDQRESLIAEYAPLVRTIAGRLAIKLPRHISQDDLLSSGIMGLLDAIDKFDSQKGVEFKSYAEFRIRGAMIDELRSMDWVPRSVRRNAKRLEEAYNKVEKEKMRPATDEEVAGELGLEIDRFYRLLDETRSISLIRENGENNFNHQSEKNGLGKPGHPWTIPNPLESLNRAEARDVIAETIDDLPKNERMVVALYYYEELTMKEIGKVMGYTESRVSQLHTKAIIRLRNGLKDYFEN